MQARTKLNKFNTGNARKLTAFAISIAPALKPYTGWLISYLSKMELNINSEGIQAVSRYKAYKRAFLDYIHEGDLPEKRLLKSKQLQIVLRIVDALREAGKLDQKSISALHTCLRYYDAFMASRKQQQKDVDKFISTYITSTPPSFTKGVLDEDLQFFSYEDIVDLAEKSGYFQFLGEPKLRITEMPPSLMKAGVLKQPFSMRKKVGDKSKFAPTIIEAPTVIALSREYSMEEHGVDVEGMTYFDLINRFKQALCNKASFSFKPHIYETTINGIDRYHRPTFRYISAFPQGGYKERTVCKGDYLAQSSLCVLHDSEFSLMSKLPSDYTFNQDEGFKQMAVLTLDNPVYCYDLSAATDAMPIEPQTMMLQRLYGDDIALGWYYIMRHVPNQYGYYRLGQPMGMYSSWATFTLTHHMVVWAAAYKAKIRGFSRHPERYYGIVGDDIFIANVSLAHEYQKLMAGLNVKINLTKSHLSDPDGNTVAEFVKRNSYCGYEITAISPNLILKSYTDISELRSLQTNLMRHFPDYPDFQSRVLKTISAISCELPIRQVIKRFAAIPTYVGGLSVGHCTDDQYLLAVASLSYLYYHIDNEFKRPFYNSLGMNRREQFVSWADQLIPGSYEYKTIEDPVTGKQQTVVSAKQTPLQRLIRNVTLADTKTLVSKLVNGSQLIKLLDEIDVEKDLEYLDAIIGLISYDIKDLSIHGYVFDKGVEKALSRKQMWKTLHCVTKYHESCETQEAKAECVRDWARKILNLVYKETGPTDEFYTLGLYREPLRFTE